MPKIVLYTSGTLGDHLPFLALGGKMASRSWDVLAVINQAMHPYAERLGLPALAVTDIDRGPEEARANPWAWDHWNNEPGSPPPGAKVHGPDDFADEVDEIAQACAGADLLLATSIRVQGLAAALVTGLPWLTLSMNPHAFPGPLPREQARSLERVRLGEHRFWHPILTHTLARLNPGARIPDPSPAWAYSPQVLLASSRHFCPTDEDQLQPWSSVDLTGFCFYEDPAWSSWRPDPELAAFCDRGPVVLTFSSQPLADPAAILNRHVRAAHMLGLPLLVVGGWAGFSVDMLPDDLQGDVLFSDFLPHDWLFARATCAIQHGGIGSLARALRQGCPLLVEPFGNDQFFNAAQVEALGAGASLHPFKSTAEDIAQTLETRVLTREARTKARTVGEKIAGEDGLDRACQLIDTFHGRRNRTVQMPGIAKSTSLPPVPPLGRDHLPPIYDQEDMAFGAIPNSPIPAIIHQTWKTAHVPEEFRAYRDSWLRHHLGWRYCLWTDWDCRELIRRHYAWFLSVYDAYPKNIMRADAFRYFVLHRYGGLYVDMDFEALRPQDAFLADKDIVLGLEPELHARQHQVSFLVCNAYMASVPGHPFWEHVHKALVAWHRHPEPLDVAGPFMLTRAWQSWPERETVPLVDEKMLYPITSQELWADLPPRIRKAKEQQAVSVHHWASTWFREQGRKPPRWIDRLVSVKILVLGKETGACALRLPAALEALTEAPRPLISCLMVTRDRPALAQRAVVNFSRQSYPFRELVVIHDGPADAFTAWLATLDDPRIRLIALPDRGRPLGALRNRALAEARGTFVAQWDDDDLSDPMRLEIQMAVLHMLGVEACFLERETIWWPQRGRAALSCRRIWEGSFLARKDLVGPYPEIRRGEDSGVVEKIAAEARTAVLDLPELYLYVCHDRNTFGSAHWDQHWTAATEAWEGPGHLDVLRSLASRMGPDMFVLPPVFNPHQTLDGKPPEPSALGAPGSPVTATPVAAKPRTSGAHPRVLVLSPVKDAMGHLPLFLARLERLAFPRERLSLGLLESDSRDGTHEYLVECLPELRQQWSRVAVMKKDFGLHTRGSRWRGDRQLERRSVLARSRNALVQAALEDEDWVLWMDSDVQSWPGELIGELLEVRGDIVAANCVRENGEPFDLNTFQLTPEGRDRDWTPYLRNGLIHPPQGLGRRYLTEFEGREPVLLDGVGGTALLVRADLHREGLIFPPFPYKGFIETEGLAVMARDMGVSCWGAPWIRVVHP